MAKSITADVNVDGVMDENDRYGLDIDTQMRSAGTDNKTDIMSIIIAREDVYVEVIKKVVDSFEG